MQAIDRLLLCAASLVVSGAVCAKLPPLSDEAKAKAAEAAAKTAHADKVAAFKLCQAQDRAVAHYVAAAKKGGKEVKVGAPGAPCADPGPFVASPPSAAAAPAPAPAAAPAPATAPAQKKS